jgi:hypothetical protein
MADADAPRACRALWRLADARGGLPFLREKLRPVRHPGPGRLARLVADLGSPDYATREEATRGLKGLGEAARGALEKAREDVTAPEVRLRAERLLRHMNPRAPERLREARALQLLEYLGTSEARRQLADLAGGAPGARLTEEAKGALQRLARWPSAPRP